jgi:hypothetical protein
VYDIAREAGGRPVQDTGGAARRQGGCLRIAGPQLGQKREDLLGRLAFAEHHFRDAGPPSAIYVQQGEVTQRDTRRPGLRSWRHSGCPRQAGTLSRHG